MQHIVACSDGIGAQHVLLPWLDTVCAVQCSAESCFGQGCFQGCLQTDAAANYGAVQLTSLPICVTRDLVRAFVASPVGARLAAGYWGLVKLVC